MRRCKQAPYLKSVNKLSMQTFVLVFIYIMSFTASYSKEANSDADFSVDKTLQGKITDSVTGEAMIGATVQVKGTSIGAVTDFEGNFAFSVPDDATILIITYVGYDDIELEIGSQTFFDIQLNPSLESLAEVVVVGYGTQRKKDLTGAIASVKAEDFNKGIVNSPEDLLQGKTAGVQISSNTGQPGAAKSIFIRGINSVNNNADPLYVVDGVLLNNEDGGSSFSSEFGNALVLNPLNFLNPSDIESIEVLKDASATAIYGSRAANGVIIITTKGGFGERSGITYNTTYGVSRIRKKLDLYDGNEYRELMESYDLPENVFDETTNTDWQDVIFRDAISQNHQLSMTGSSESMDYYLSLSYQSQEGIIESNELETYTARLNLNHSIVSGFLADKVDIKLNLTYSHVDNDANAFTNDFSSTGTMMSDMIQANPTFPAYDENGDIFQFPSNYRNPLILLEQIQDFARTDRFLGAINPTIKILPNLTYKINLSVDKSTNNREFQLSPSLLNFDGPEGGRVDFRKRENTNVLVENYLTYQLVKNSSEMTFLAGHSYQYFKFRSLFNSIQNFQTDEIEPFFNPGLGSEINFPANLPGGSARISELQSFFGRATYSYKGKYLFTGTARADGSSKFGTDRKYGFFPSASIGWNITDEVFMGGISDKAYLKLRASWGQTGNQNIPQGISLPLWNIRAQGDNTYPILDDTEDTPSYVVTRTRNEEIQWETTTQTNVGLDFEIFDGKVTGSVDYFNKSTTDVLQRIVVADPLAPATETWDNVDMDITNKGFEFAVSYTQELFDDFNLSVSANATVLENNVDGLPSELTVSRSRGPANQNIGIYRNGEAVNSFLLREFIGFDEDGREMFTDADEDGIDDLIIAGSPVPDLVYNFSTTFRYKGFGLTANFNGMQGNDVFNSTLTLLSQPFIETGANGSPVNFREEESIDNPILLSTRYLEDGSFLRLNNVTLSYDFDLTDFKYCESLRVFVTGQNLWVLTDYSGYDPEVSNNRNVGGVNGLGIDYTNYPNPMSFLVGLEVSF